MNSGPTLKVYSSLGAVTWKVIDERNFKDRPRAPTPQPRLIKTNVSVECRLSILALASLYQIGKSFLQLQHKVHLEFFILKGHYNWRRKMSSVMFCIEIKSPTNSGLKAKSTRTAFCHRCRFFLLSIMFPILSKQEELDIFNEPLQLSTNISNNICIFPHFSLISP